MEGPKAVNAYQNTIVDQTVLVININNMYQFDSGYALTQSLKKLFKIGQPFLKTRDIAIDYQWLVHWKFTVNLA